MSDPSPFSRTRSPDAISPRAPESWAWVAAVFIVIMGAYGLYRGIAGAQGGAGLLPTPHAGDIVAPVDAANAAPAPKDAQWSTLSGPQVIPPIPPGLARAAKAAATDDDASDGPPDTTAAANAEDAGQGDTPPPAKAKPVKAAPVPDEDAPPATAPTGQ